MNRLYILLSLSIFLTCVTYSCRWKSNRGEGNIGCADADILYTFNSDRDYEHGFLGREELYALLNDDRLACITLGRLIVVLNKKFVSSSTSIGHLINKALKREIVFDYDELKEQSEFIFTLEQSIWQFKVKSGFEKFKEKYSYGESPLKFHEPDSKLLRYSILYVFFTEGYIHVNEGVSDTNYLVEAKGYMGVT